MNVLWVIEAFFFVWPEVKSGVASALTNRMKSEINSKKKIFTQIPKKKNEFQYINN